MGKIMGFRSMQENHQSLCIEINKMNHRLYIKAIVQKCQIIYETKQFKITPILLNCLGSKGTGNLLRVVVC